MNRSIRSVLQMGVLGMVLTCAACTQGEAEAPIAETETPEAEMEKPSSIGGMLSKKVSAAVADLSARTGISTDAITVTKASIVNWGSSAVGCPRDGMNYTQAIVPGVLVLLEADGKVYRYHGSNNSELFHCPDDRAEAPAHGSGEEFM